MADSDTTPNPGLLVPTRQAIADPGSFLHRESGETVANWGARAVLASVVQPELDRRDAEIKQLRKERDDARASVRALIDQDLYDSLAEAVEFQAERGEQYRTAWWSARIGRAEARAGADRLREEADRLRDRSVRILESRGAERHRAEQAEAAIAGKAIVEPSDLAALLGFVVPGGDDMAVIENDQIDRLFAALKAALVQPTPEKSR